MSNIILVSLIAAGIGIALGYFYRKRHIEQKNRDIQGRGERIFQEAQTKAKEILYEAKNEAFRELEKVKAEEEKKQEKSKVHNEAIETFEFIKYTAVAKLINTANFGLKKPEILDAYNNPEIKNAKFSELKVLESKYQNSGNP